MMTATSTSPRLKLDPPYTQKGRAAARLRMLSARTARNQNLMCPRSG